MIAYIVPFLFIFFPGLLFKGTALSILIAVATALLGCFALSAALSGYLFKRLNPLMRIILVLAGVALMIPVRHGDMTTILCNIIGGGLTISLIFKEWYGREER